MLRYIKRFNFSILIFIFISLFFSLEISKMEVIRMNFLEQNSFFTNDSIIFHINADQLTPSEFLGILLDEEGVMFQKMYIREGAFSGQALYLAEEPIEFPNILEGRYFHLEDFNNIKPVAVIGKELESVTTSKGGEDYIRIGGIEYEVIGIMGGKGSTLNNQFLINYNAYVLNGNEVFEPRDFYQVKWSNDIESKFTELHIKLRDLDAQITLTKNNSRMIRNPIEVYVANRLKYIGVIFLILLLNIVSITSYYLEQREREVGVLKAYGIRNITIIKKVVLEYVSVAFIAFMIGILFHLIVYKVVYSNIPYYKIQTNNLFGITIASLITGLIASLWPTIKLLKVEPNEIMKR